MSARRGDRSLAERHESLWLLVTPPSLWGVHFLLSYVTAAVWCAKATGPGAPLDPVRSAIAVYTALALAAIALFAWKGWRRHALGGADAPHDDDTPLDRHRFLGYATFLLSLLSAVAVVYAAVAASFFGSCR